MAHRQTTRRPPTGDKEWRIDDLARDAGITVRTARSYITRGLLAPPLRVKGRTNYYGEFHRSRLKLISDLLERGYGLDSIGELLGAWEEGHPLSDLLGFEVAVGRKWSDEPPAYVTTTELDELFGPDGVAARARAVELGYLVAEGDRWRLPSPTLVAGAVELVRVGIPLADVIEYGARLAEQLDRVAAEFMDLLQSHVLPRYVGEHGAVDRADGQLAAIAELAERLRPIAQDSVNGHLAMAMDRLTGELLVELAERARDPAAQHPASRAG